MPPLDPREDSTKEIQKAVESFLEVQIRWKEAVHTNTFHEGQVNRLLIELILRLRALPSQNCLLSLKERVLNLENFKRHLKEDTALQDLNKVQPILEKAISEQGKRKKVVDSKSPEVSKDNSKEHKIE